MKKICIAMCTILVCGVVCFALCANGLGKQKQSELLLDANVEALTNNEESETYVICYYESKTVVGYTYYDCGTCRKVYDEKGYRKYSKCLFK